VLLGSALGAGVLVLGLASANAQDRLRMGVLLPLTGVNSPDGTRVLQGHQLAAKHINEAGGIKAANGAKIELVVADTQSQPEIARAEAERLISRERVQVLTGAWTTGATQPALQLAERNKIPFIIPNAFVDMLTEQGFKYAFRITSKSSYITRDVMNFSQYLRDKGAQVSRVGIIFEDNAYGQSVYDVAKGGFAERGFELVASPSFKGGAADLNTQVAQLKAANAQLVVLGCFAADAAVILKTMAAQNYRPVILGLSAGYMHPLVLQLGELSERTFGITDWMPDIKNEASAKFVAAYEAEYKEKPINAIALAYLTVYVAAYGAEAAGSISATKIRDGIAQLNVKDGPAGMLPGGIRFDETGQNQTRNIGAENLGGQFTTIWPEEVALKPLLLPGR
jgi:branched-chain amino acid transport system substrate-binding protein